MFIKKHKSKNQYILTQSVFVRDFTNDNCIPLDINQLSSNTDESLYIDNEFENFTQRYANIDNENLHHSKVVIVSDGHNFKSKQDVLAKLPKDVAIIGVNGSLKYWKLLGNSDLKRAINYYVVNNPYKECTEFLPTQHRYYPKCIASSRTNPGFLKKYLGNKYIYTPVENEKYSGIERFTNYKIDDYRNPVCAAISLAYRFAASKILMFCCDSSFADERPGAEKLDNGLWCYPQQQLSKSIIDSMFYWLNCKKIEIGDCSAGGKYNNAKYIESEDDVVRYFNDE